ncbi:MAG: hypothetical protein V7L05_18305 [Nostoc sp.]
MKERGGDEGDEENNQCPILRLRSVQVPNAQCPMPNDQCPMTI